MRRKKPSVKTFSFGEYEVTVKGPKSGYSLSFECEDGEIRIGQPRSFPIPPPSFYNRTESAHNSAASLSVESGDPDIIGKPVTPAKIKSTQQSILEDFGADVGADPNALLAGAARLGETKEN